MRKLLLIGAGMMALAGAGVAVAQAPPPAGGAAPQAAAPPPPPPPDGGPRGGWGGPGRGPRGPHGPEMGPPEMRPRGARFHFSRGDATVDVHCAANEPTRACVDAAAVLLDKLSAQPAR